MLMRFCEEQNLRALFSDKVSSDAIQLLQPAFEKAFGSGSRGTLFGDMLAVGVSDDDLGTTRPSWKLSESSKLSNPLVALLSSWLKRHPELSPPDSAPCTFRTKHTDSIRSRDNIYKVASVSGRDSFVIFTKEDSNDWFAGQVEEIFLYGHENGASIVLTERFLVLAEFEDLPVEFHGLDSFRRFPIAGGRLYQTTHKRERVLLPLRNISCPFAMTPHTVQTGTDRTFPCIHVLPLDKVSSEFIQMYAYAEIHSDTPRIRPGTL